MSNAFDRSEITICFLRAARLYQNKIIGKSVGIYLKRLTRLTCQDTRLINTIFNFFWNLSNVKELNF